MDRSLLIDPAYDDSLMSVPLSLHSLERALVLAPAKPNGFGRADIKRVEHYSEFVDAAFSNNAYVVELKDGRRFFLEYSCDESTSARSEYIEIEQMENFSDGPIILTPTISMRLWAPAEAQSASRPADHPSLISTVGRSLPLGGSL